MKAGRIFILGLSWVVVMGWGMVAVAQAPDTLWTRTYGGPGEDKAYCIRETTDGGFIIAGSTSSYGAGGLDCWLVKINNNGDTLWTRTYGGPDNDEAFSVAQTADGGYVFVGYSRLSSSTYEKIYVVRVNSTGDTVWTRFYQYIFYPTGVDEFRDNRGYSVTLSNDGGIVFTGFSKWLSTDWPGYPPENFGQMVLQKLGSNGGTQWLRSYGLTFGQFDQNSGYSIRSTTGGGYIVAGKYDNVSRVLMWLLKANNQGNLVWNQFYGPEGGVGYDVQSTEDGGYIIAGQNTYLSGGGSYCLVKTDSNGNEEWHRGYNIINNACSVEVLPDRGYIITGSGIGWPSLPLVRTNSNGDTLWTKRFGQIGHIAEGRSLILTSDGGYLVAGYTTGAMGYDFYVIKLEPELQVPIQQHSPLPEQYILHNAYPNPFNSTTTISYEVPVRGRVRVNIYNILGQEVATVADGVVSPGSYSVVWDAGELPSGIYFVKMEAGEFVQTRKVVLLK